MSERLLQVIENYELKLRGGAAGTLSESEIQRRVGRYGIAAVREDQVLTQVRQLLCGAGVVPMMFPAYYSYARELGKLTRQDLSWELLPPRAGMLAEKWALRGLRPEVLRDIACIAYNISLPSAPEEAGRGSAAQ